MNNKQRMLDTDRTAFYSNYYYYRSTFYIIHISICDNTNNIAIVLNLTMYTINNKL